MIVAKIWLGLTHPDFRKNHAKTAPLKRGLDHAVFLDSILNSKCIYFKINLKPQKWHSYGWIERVGLNKQYNFFITCEI